jgi:hypothetical protein
MVVGVPINAPDREMIHCTKLQKSAACRLAPAARSANYLMQSIGRSARHEATRAWRLAVGQAEPPRFFAEILSLFAKHSFKVDDCA